MVRVTFATDLFFVVLARFFFEGSSSKDGPSAFQVGPRDASLAPSRASHRAHYTVRVHVPLVVGDTALSEANDRVRVEQTRVGGPSAFRPRPSWEGDHHGEVGRGDSRWIVQERDDGANVNGWHWQERNMICLLYTSDAADE